MVDNNFVNNNKKSYIIEYVCVFFVSKNKADHISILFEKDTHSRYL